MDRDAERNSKREGARIKIKPEQELCFQGLVGALKQRCFWEYGKASYTSFCRNYVRVLVSQDRDKEDNISVSDI